MCRDHWVQGVRNCRIKAEKLLNAGHFLSNICNIANRPEGLIQPGQRFIMKS